MYTVYSKIISGVHFNSTVDCEIAAADWSAEETRGHSHRWGPRIRKTDIDALSYATSSVWLSLDIRRWSDNF